MGRGSTQGDVRSLPRRAAALAAAVCLVASCSAEDTRDRRTDREAASPRPPATSSQSPRAAGSPPQRSAPGEAPLSLPRVPSTRDPAALARQIDRAGAVLRSSDAGGGEVRRAAEFHQLAVRALATGREASRRKVLNRLRPATARQVRGDVLAGRALHELSSPRRTLPSGWRIVEPPQQSELRGYYRQAQRRTGVPWSYLAAIHLVETRMGRIRGVSTAGAQGPMQFLPSTWELYGEGGDISDPRDAIHAAARLLKHRGAPDDMGRALWHYNPSQNYVRAVTEYARTMQRSPSAYRGYWHWRVLYRHERGTYVLPVGYPGRPPVLLRDLGRDEG